MEEFAGPKTTADPKSPSYIALMMSSAKAGDVIQGDAQTLAVSANDSAASAISEQTSSQHPDLPSSDFNPRKRKCQQKTKVPENNKKEKCGNGEESNKERQGTKIKGKDGNNSDTAESCPKQVEDNKASTHQPKQDYIHVRARRGQATDSHSLAERVRREKISERMRILQDLVPGCNKITGKAVMLDEIINYVQALQRQVEFLSMKLAAVNPQPDFNLDGSYLAKDPNSTTAMFVPDKMIASNQHQQPQKFTLEQSMQSKEDEHGISEAAIRRMLDAQFHCSNGQTVPMFQNLQISQGWDNEFQHGVDPRIYNHNKSAPLATQGFQGHMKVEL